MTSDPIPATALEDGIDPESIKRHLYNTTIYWHSRKDSWTANSDPRWAERRRYELIQADNMLARLAAGETIETDEVWPQGTKTPPEEPSE